MGKLDNCTGAIVEIGETLAYYRLLKPGRTKYFAREMDSDQLSERRIFLRKALASFPNWANLSNEELEDIRLYRLNDVYVAENKEGQQFFLKNQETTKSESKFRQVRAMMPFDFMELTGKDFDWKKYKADILEPKTMVNKYIMNYLRFKEQGMGLYIHSGTKGSGKTMLACCMINELTTRYVGSVKFVNILDFLEMTKKSYSGDNEVESIYKASLLVIDDIGVQMSKEWVDTVLYRLINERYVNRLPTIYTSNIAVDRLKIDDRIIDRIESRSYIVTLPEESIRRTLGQQDKERLLQDIQDNKSINSMPGGNNRFEKLAETAAPNTKEPT